MSGTYAYDPAAGYLGRDLKGIVLLSSRLRIDVSPENPFADGVRAYFGDDPSVYETRSPVTHAAVSALPVMIAIAEFENPLLDLYGLELAHRIASCAPPRTALHASRWAQPHFDGGALQHGRGQPRARDRGIHAPPSLRPGANDVDNR